MERLKKIGIWAAWFGLAFLVFGPTIAGRNGSGTYTVPNTFVSGATITASGFNQNFSDLGSEITNSVAADGQTSMTGPLKAEDGTAAAPAFTFASNTNTGLFRKAANTLGIAIAGSEIGYFDSTGLTLSGSLSLSNGQTVPAGTVLPFAGSSAPAGYLLAYGQAVSRTTYAALFAVIGTTYGAGDGSTTFNLPDLRGRTIAGADDMGGSAASRLTSTYFGTSAVLAAVGGSQSHTLTQAELSVNLGTATSVVTDPGHTHVEWGVGGAGGQNHVVVNSGAGSEAATLSTTGSSTTGVTVATTITNASGGNAHAIVPPTIITNYIIKT